MTQKTIALLLCCIAIYPHAAWPTDSRDVVTLVLQGIRNSVQKRKNQQTTKRVYVDNSFRNSGIIAGGDVNIGNDQSTHTQQITIEGVSNDDAIEARRLLKERVDALDQRVSALENRERDLLAALGRIGHTRQSIASIQSELRDLRSEKVQQDAILRQTRSDLADVASIVREDLETR